jgi:hypothetical protein
VLSFVLPISVSISDLFLKGHCVDGNVERQF